MLERAEMLRSELASMKPAGVEITVSIGLACTADHPDDTLTRFLSVTDKALYMAKENGRNRIYIYTADGATASPWNEDASIAEAITTFTH